MGTKKGARSGGKYTGSHTTVIPAAARLVDVLAKHALVTKIALGFIKAGLPSARGQRSVKVKLRDLGSVLLAVRDNTSHQEIRVYTKEPDVVLAYLRTHADEIGLTVYGV